MKNNNLFLVVLAALSLATPAFAQGIDMTANGAQANLGDSGAQTSQPGGSFGFDQGSPATQSAGNPGDTGRTTDFSRGNYYGNTMTTSAQYQTTKGEDVVKEYNDINLLSNYSFDNSAVPSGSYSFGFTGSGELSDKGAQYGGNGWYLPKTSTGSVDLNIVSP